MKQAKWSIGIENKITNIRPAFERELCEWALNAFQEYEIENVFSLFYPSNQTEI